VSVVRRVDTAVYLGATHCPMDMLVRWLPLLSSRRLPSGLVSLAGASGADLDVAARGDMREESRFVIATWRISVFFSLCFSTTLEEIAMYTYPNTLVCDTPTTLRPGYTPLVKA
jgi:hypothetical protein